MFRYGVLKKSLFLMTIIWICVIVGLGYYQKKVGVDGIRLLIVPAGILTVALFYFAISVVLTAIRISVGLSTLSSTSIEKEAGENPLFSLFLSSDFEEIISQRKIK